MDTIDNDWLERVLPTVRKPGRYVGAEWNVIKKGLDKVDVKFALAFPDIYDVGMSYLGLRIIYGALNSRDGIACERVFAPWIDFEEVMRRDKVSLYSLESRVPVKDFDIVGFSLTYELNYTNVLNMLDLAGIPVRSKDRSDDHPLVIAGGPCAINPEPMLEFFDAFIIGEGEEAALEVCDVFKYGKAKGREFVLQELAKLEGVYVPAHPKKAQKRIVKDLDNAFYPTKELVPNVQVIHDRISLEIMRGCPFNCKFCQASAIYRPVRLRSPRKILELAKVIYKNTGYEEISLLSLSSSSYPGICDLVSKLIDEFKELGVGISLPSLRSDDILEHLPVLIAKIRKSSLTFAIEAGSERLRKYINKDINIDRVVQACDAAFKSGWRHVKFYFMIGFPTETQDDLDKIPEFIDSILGLKNNINMSMSVNAFVPKFHTAFADREMDSMESLIEKQKFLRRRLTNRRIKLSFHDVRLSYLEGMLNRHDVRLSRIIYGAWERGAKLDAWREKFDFDIWMRAIQKDKLDP